MQSPLKKDGDIIPPEVANAGVNIMFSDKVRDIVRKIPKGKTMTYKEVASKAGNPKAARAVGAVMRSNYDPSIPCHRIVASDGKMRGYNRGARIR